MIAAPAAPTHGQAMQENKKIILIYSHNANAPALVEFLRQLKAVVGERYPTAEIYEEHLEADRLPSATRPEQITRYFADKYRGFRPDAILVEGTPGLKFIVEQLLGVFPNVPVVYGGAFEPILDFASLPANVVGRRQLLPFASTYTLARALQPDAQRVLLVGGSSPTDSLLVAEARRQITPILDGMTLDEYQDWTYEGLIDSLRHVSPRTVVLLSDFSRDQRGIRRFIPGDLVASLATVASAPVYGIARNWVGQGIVGGGVMDFGDDGARTATLLVRALARHPGDPMPASEVAANRVVVDWRQLQRWGLGEEHLPANSEILFRPLSAWQRYRRGIIGALALFLIESLLIALLLLEGNRRRRAQRAVEEQVEYERMMRALTADLARRSALEVTDALEETLSRVARFAGASAAVLGVANGNGADATYMIWTEATDAVRRSTSRPDVPSVEGRDRLEVPLIVEHVTYGALELFHAAGATWPSEMAVRLRAVGDLIAGALARASTARLLEQTRGQVEHMGRVATLNELASAVSHELSQPLSAIRINAEAGALLLARTPPEVDEARLALQEIVRDDARAAEVVKHYRALLHQKGTTNAAVDVNALCRNTAKLMDPEVTGRRATLELELEPDVPLVRGDPVQLQQALMNLTLNALDAVTASATREVGIRTATKNGNVEVEVTDTGPGLSPDVQQRLFEPFFSTKPHGLGMGVPIVRSIVERHHGSLRAENRAEGGARFTVTLPTVGRAAL
jgi:signal transduction histidine kinase